MVYTEWGVADSDGVTTVMPSELAARTTARPKHLVPVLRRVIYHPWVVQKK